MNRLSPPLFHVVRRAKLVPLLLGFALAAPVAAADSRAVLQVFGGAGAGCGTLVRVDGERGWLLTAAHVVKGSPRCRLQWANGQTRDAEVVASDEVLDVALVTLAAPPEAITLPLAGPSDWPRQGDVVELVGYGGGRLRHWSAKVNGYALTDGLGKHQTLSLDTQTIGGDSGGAIVFREKVVGVIWGGPLAGPRGPMVATHGTCCVAIDALVRRAVPSWPPSAASPAAQIAAYPPCASGNCPLVPPTPIRSPAAPRDCCAELRAELRKLEARVDALARTPTAIDVQQVVEAIVKRIAADERFRGPPGIDGIDGRDGASANVEALAEQVKQRLAGSLRIRVAPAKR